MVKSTEREDATIRHRSFDYETKTPCSVGYNVVYSFHQFELVYRPNKRENCVNCFVAEMIEFEKAAMGFYCAVI